MAILLFAGLAEAAGQRELHIAQPPFPVTVAELEVRVRESCPDLAGRPFRVAVNQRYGQGSDPVAATDEIALIPPVSGG